MRTAILLPYPLLISQEKSEAGAALVRQQVRSYVPHLCVRRVFYEATRQPRSAVAASVRPVDSVRPHFKELAEFYCNYTTQPRQNLHILRKIILQIAIFSNFSAR